MQEVDSLAEAARLMTICNSCRYCEGLCAVFPAMEMRRSFETGDLNLLANLCHGCGACLDACQFAPPHEFAVNVPRAMARLRRESWETYVWPASLAGVLHRNGTFVAAVLALSVAAFLVGFAAWQDAGVLFGRHRGPGAFYRLMPHDLMAILFGGAFLFAITAIMWGVRAFWRDANRDWPLRIGLRALARAMRDAGSLKYLDGGGAGCEDEEREAVDHRRLYHHLTFYGFMLCFAATAIATLYHFVLGREAPYAWFEPPVLLGTAGGIGLLIGPIGLMRARRRRSAELVDRQAGGMDDAFSLMLFATALTGIALLVLRSTPAMGVLLALHLGVVFALFVTLPYSRFVHGFYRFTALTRYAAERQSELERAPKP